mgnify:CR=1 FL=1
MEELDALRAQRAEVAGLLEGLTAEDWATPSRCAGWSVADVVIHLAQTEELALATLQDNFDQHLHDVLSEFRTAADVDEGADLLVAAERGRPSTEVLAWWSDVSARVIDAFAARAPRDRVGWVAGTLTARTLAATRMTEHWIHAGDIAGPLGIDIAPTDRLRLTARLAWRTLPYAFESAGRHLDGPVALHLTGPSGARWDLDPPAGPDGPGHGTGAPITVVRGPALDLCLVAARRVDAGDTALEADGPDAGAVLELIRTYA